MKKVLVGIGMITMVLAGCSRDDFGKRAEGGSLRADASPQGEPSYADEETDDSTSNEGLSNNSNVGGAPFEPGNDQSLGSERRASRVALKGFQAMRGASDNVVISGLGLTRSLSIAALAASDSTVQDGIFATLEFSNDPGSLNSSVAQLIADVSLNAAPGRLDLIPSVWVDSDRVVEPAFLNTLDYYHGIGARTANFRSGVREAMNTWFRGESEGYVLDTVQPRSIPVDANFALVDATYFRGSWALPFDPALEYQGRFRGLRSGVDVGMMVLNGSVLYAESDESEMVVLPYQSGFSLIAIKPRADTPEGLERLEDSLSLTSVDEVFDRAQARALSVHFPRVQVGGRFNLDAADLPDLADIRTGESFENASRGAVLANVVQRTLLRFDRTQTTADPESNAPPELDDARGQEVRFDRPFVFLVRDTSTGTLVLVGRVGQPSNF